MSEMREIFIRCIDSHIKWSMMVEGMGIPDKFEIETVVTRLGFAKDWLSKAALVSHHHNIF